MKTQIKVIRFVAIMSIFLAAVTYLITVNIEVGFINLSTPWLSNNFLLTVCGGAFASMLVVLLCEIQKYFEIKHTAENEIFAHGYNGYTQLIVLREEVQKLLANPDQTVTKDLLTTATSILKDEINILSRIEFCTFSKRTKLEKVFSEFCQNTAGKITAYTITEGYLTLAVLADQMRYMDEHRATIAVTSSSPVTNETLKNIDAMIRSYITEVENFLEKVDDSCGKRFHWSLAKQSINNGIAVVSDVLGNILLK